MFEENDKPLMMAYKIIKVALIICGIFFVIGGVVLCATCKQEVPNGFGSETVTNVANIVVGVLFIIFGPIICWLIWVFNKLILSAFCDIKIIRNKLYALDNEYLKLFSEKDENDDLQNNALLKKKSFLEKFKDL